MRVIQLGLLPVPVIYTVRVPHLLEAGGGPDSGSGGGIPWYAPVILVHPDCRGDEGILQHELEHVRQWWTAFFLVGGAVLLNLCALRPALGGFFWEGVFFGLWLSWLSHPLLYLASRRYRLWSEVAAYKTQMKHTDGRGARLSLAAAAEMLSGPRYGLSLTPTEARRRLAEN